VITNLLEATCFLGLCNQRLYVNNVIISELNNYPEEYNKLININII
jgi:hypothetical protein